MAEKRHRVTLSLLLAAYGAAWYDCCEGLSCEAETVARRAIDRYIRKHYQRRKATPKETHG